MTEDAELSPEQNEDLLGVSDMAEGAELSQEQLAAVSEFQFITGIDNMESCRDILETHNWDLGMAVQVILEGTPVVAPFHNALPAVNVDPPDQRVFFGVRPRQPTDIVLWSFRIMSYPLQLLYVLLAGIVSFVINLAREYPKRAVSELRTTITDPGGAVTDPFGDVINFIELFEEKYGEEHPDFIRGTYSEAVNNARQNFKFLLVYLHGEDYLDTNEFCRDVLCDARVVEFINSNFLFWACSVDSPEGYRVSQALLVTSCPYLVVIILREDEMTAVARLGGPTEPETLIRQLQLIKSDNEASLEAAMLERTEAIVLREETQAIRQLQDELYLESLRADQEKERKRKEKQEQKELEEKNRILEDQRQKEEIERRKTKLLEMVEEEPSLNSPSTIRLMIKFPNGARMERRFSKENSLKFLYYFVFGQTDTPDSFELFTSFPRRALPCEPSENGPEPPTFEEFGLMGNTEVIFVEDSKA